MAILKVARLGHPVLRQVAAPLAVRRLRSAGVQRLIDDLIETMRSEDGVGLAAPQVHVPLRVVAYEMTGDQRAPAATADPLRVLVNPALTVLDEATEEDWEGCLSLPDLRGRVPRWSRIRVDALDRRGQPLSYTARGFHARVVQHECDHLDGVVFLDRMRDLSSLAFLAEFERFAGHGRPRG
jgi:peptide deformylase